MKKRKATLDDLCEFLGTFERPGFRFGEVVSRPGEFPFVSLAPEELAFIEALYQADFLVQFDWPAWQEAAEEYVEDALTLQAADLDTLRRLMTVHVRKDRFCDGHLLDMFENGHVVAVLRRLRELQPTKPARRGKPPRKQAAR